VKLKYERYEGLGCLYVRGAVDITQFKLLVVGLDTLAKDLEETLLVNLSAAALDAAIVPTLVQIKKKLSASTHQKIYWVAKDKGVGDFVTIDLFLSRLNGFKFRQIADRIKLEDEVHGLSENQKQLETKEAELGGSAANARAIVLENKILREQKRILEESLVWQRARIALQEPVEPATKLAPVGTEEAVPDEELPVKIKNLKAELKKVLGVEVDL
jgi:hypothetical protein